MSTDSYSIDNNEMFSGVTGLSPGDKFANGLILDIIFPSIGASGLGHSNDNEMFLFW